MFTKKFLILIFIVVNTFLFVSCNIESVKEEKYDFQNVNWGMTKVEVQECQRRSFDKEEEWYGRYTSDISVFGFYVMSLTYYFNLSGELHSIYTNLFFKQTDTDGFVSDYNKMKSEMIMVYDQPVTDTGKGVWDEYEFQSKAIEDLFLFCKEADYFTQWKLERSEIALAMMQEGPIWMTHIMLESLVINHDRENQKKR